MADPYDRIRGLLDGVTDRGDDQCEALCPAHDDNRASLSLARGKDGDAVLHCHAGCKPQAIVSAVGLEMKDLFMPNKNGHAGNGHANGKPRIVAAYDYRDEGGNLLFQKVRYDPKGFRQRAPNTGGGWNWSLKNVRKVVYNLDKLSADRERNVWFFEGEKDCDNATRRELLATTNPDGASKGKSKFDKKLAEQLRGRVVRICGDNDEAGRNHARHVATILSGIASSVRVVELPGLPEKGDVTDWFSAGHTVEELQALAEATPEFVPSKSNTKTEIVNPTGERPMIVVDHSIKRMVDEGIAALARIPGIYQRAGALARVVEGGENPPGIERPADAPRIVTIERDTIDELLPEAADWVKRDPNGECTRAAVPDKVTKALAARGGWPKVPKITAVIETPVVRRDGSVVDALGYDEQTGLVLWSKGKFPPVPNRPSRDDAIAAIDKLREVAEDFPFATNAHRSAWIAGVLTPFARFAYHGPAPLMLVDANVRGTGKSLLQKVTSAIISGREIASMSLPRNDGEFAKTIASIAVAGLTNVLIDNIAGVLASPSFDAALTSTSWNSRLLGATRMIGELPLIVTWYATGNNVSIAADTTRRTLHTRLESPLEKPEERTGFKQANLLDYVKANHCDLAIACCTVLAAYIAAGKPDQGLREWGSFESWSRLIRGAIVWAGHADPGDTRVVLAERSDLEANALKSLLAAWEELAPDGKGLTALQALQMLDENPDRYAVAREVFAGQFSHSKAAPASTHRIGKRLSGFRRRVIGGRMFDCEPDRNGIQKWKVVADSAGFAGVCGGSNNPTRETLNQQ